MDDPRLFENLGGGGGGSLTNLRGQNFFISIFNFMNVFAFLMNLDTSG